MAVPFDPEISTEIQSAHHKAERHQEPRQARHISQSVQVDRPALHPVHNLVIQEKKPHVPGCQPSHDGNIEHDATNVRKVCHIRHGERQRKRPSAHNGRKEHDKGTDCHNDNEHARPFCCKQKPELSDAAPACIALLCGYS